MEGQDLFLECQYLAAVETLALLVIAFCLMCQIAQFVLQVMRELRVLHLFLLEIWLTRGHLLLLL